MDNVVLYGPGGASPVNIGTWLQQDRGVDYGVHGLLQAIETESFADGGRLAYERAGVRHMSFPLIVGSGAGLSLSLVQIESLIRKNAHQGGYIDVQPEGVASSEAVRFDIIHGRWEPDYSIYHQRLPRRQGNLLLDTQPYGYWPTVILLASGVSASYHDTFQLTWNNASILGDAPAQAVIGIHASTATAVTVSGILAGQQYSVDGIWWSMGRPSGATSFVTPSTFFAATNVNTFNGSNNILSATVASMGIAPYGAVLRMNLMASGIDAWKQLALTQMNASAAKLYAGRYRVFGSFRFWSFTPSAGSAQRATMTMQIVLDEAPGSYLIGVAPMASAYPIATLLSVAPTSAVGVGIGQFQQGDGSLGGASEVGFQLLDLGEHAFPPIASGAWSPWQLRIWGRMGTSFVGTYPRIEFAGLRFQALDGPAGFLTSGLNFPTVNNIVGTDGAGGFWGAYVTSDTLIVDTINQRIAVYNGASNGAGSNIASPPEIQQDLRARYLGEFPQLGGTEMQLDVGLIDRRTTTDGATALIGDVARAAISASVGYRPRFQFLKGL